MSTLIQRFLLVFLLVHLNSFAWSNQIAITNARIYTGTSQEWAEAVKIENGKFTETHNEYHNVLYRREIPTTFVDKVTDTFFMGKIQGIASNGKIKIQLDDDSIKEFGLKQISFAKA